MAFVNTEDIIGSAALVEAYLTGSITEFADNRILKMRPNAFSSYPNLTRIILPNVKVIPNVAFNSSNALAFVDLGSAEHIDTYNFGRSLTTLIIRTPTVCKFLSSGNDLTNCTIYVPRTLGDGSDGPAAYAAATNWSAYADQIRAIEDYPEITGGL